METVGKASFGGGVDERSINELADAIHELSKQVKELQRGSREEFERLGKHIEEGVPLEFTLVTSGLIRGKLLWIGNQSLGVMTESGQNVILYKHAIAFVQEKTED